MLLVALLACLTDDTHEVEWLLEPADLGEPRVAGSTFDPLDGAALGAAFPQLMPGWDDTFPAFEVPVAIWEVATHELVADAGVCPSEVLDGVTREYRSDCRSKHGYEWVGGATVSEWTEGDTNFTHYEFDIRIDADVESARFERLALDGTVLRAEEGSVTHVDVNLTAELTGYFEARQLPDDVRLPAWAAWGVSGSVEVSGGDLRLDTLADIGGTGSFPLRSDALVWGAICPVEPEGEASMGEAVTALFDGERACDACASIRADDRETAACAP